MYPDIAAQLYLWADLKDAALSPEKMGYKYVFENEKKNKHIDSKTGQQRSQDGIKPVMLLYGMCLQP